MALAAGDEVALKRATGATLAVSANFVFGTVIDVSSDTDVVWENGSSRDAIPAAELDKIVGEDTRPEIVTFDDGSIPYANPAYHGVVVRKYTRQTAGTGGATSYTLIRSLKTGQLYEVPSAAIVTVDAGA